MELFEDGGGPLRECFPVYKKLGCLSPKYILFL